MVSFVTDFAKKSKGGSSYNNPEVCGSHENKALAYNPAGTKVTIGFGPASAIIRFDCVIP